MFEQKKLDYSFSDMEPYLDSLTMETHYTKHHAAYTKKFNEAVEQAGWTNKTIEEIFLHLKELDNPDLIATMRNNGGGYYNHNLYFSTLKNNGKQQPVGELEKQICKNFDSFDSFQEKISSVAMGLFGSGWAWLSADAHGELCISASQNQDNPIMETAGVWTPIMAIDVWEHAYYLKYKNLRAEYIKALFHIIDWNKVEQLYVAKQK